MTTPLLFGIISQGIPVLLIVITAVNMVKRNFKKS